jgi:hypothetical protein
MKPFTVLALDGGGMRGLYSVTVLDGFARHFARFRKIDGLDVGRGFDLIAGTSTGGLAACGLAYGLSPRELIELFREVGPLVFRRPLPQSRLGFLRWAFRTLRRSANLDDALRETLESRFGDASLENVFLRRNIALCIPSVNVRTGRSWVFKTPHAVRMTRDRRFRLVDVCLSTSAAPIYLPLAAVDDPDDKDHQLMLADGGLWANNPVLVGLIEALSLAKPDQPIHILSLSTCPLPQGEMATPDARHWGLLDWKVGTTALTMALESQSWGYHYMAFQLADALRRSGRECHVIRVPHSGPSRAQARHVGLDRASERAVEILSELGKQDGDVDAAGQQWGATVSQMVADIFLNMPEAQPLPASINKRSTPRRLREIYVEDGLILRNESPTGVCLMVTGDPPSLGTVFEFAAGGVRRRGIVRWVQRLTSGATEFGVDSEAFPQDAGGSH